MGMLESHGEALGEEEAFLRLLMRVNYRSANVSAPSGKGVVMVAKQRKGQTGTTTCRDIDKLTMAYAGNQLVKAEDSGTTVSLSSSMDFKNNSNVAKEYSYDANGNLTQDLNKGISSITYNLLNLPQTLTISNSLGSATNSYTYAADGRKLKAVIGSKTTDYCNNMIYENGVLKRILVDGGYIEGGAYYFYLTDHLGNNRVVADASGNIKQTNHYYPFGMSFAEGTVTSSQPYKYNGKELDTDKGLNLYDYSARYMDPALGRFNTVDPMAEKYYSISPYVYVGNNPMKRIDPNGMLFDDYFNRKGQYLGTDNSKTDYIRIVDQEQWDINKEKDGTIDPTVGESIGILHSGANITNEASLKIFEHYNSSDLPLSNSANNNGDLAVSAFRYETKTGNPVDIAVDIDKYREIQVSDHSMEITSILIHEKKHYNDFKILGKDKYEELNNNIKEQRAVKAQVDHPSFIRMRSAIRKAFIQYAILYGHEMHK